MTPGLLERAGELAAVDDAIDAARAGDGATLLLEGAAGIGKTELVAAAIARARRAGLLVLRARADELELSFPYAVVRRLFEPALVASDPARRERLLAGAAAHAEAVVDPRTDRRSVPGDASAVSHGLYWLTANLAADQPLAVVVDDLHWSDESSAAWVAYLARRVEGLSVALILSARSSEPGANEPLLAALRTTERVVLAHPEPLSRSAVAELARAALGEDVVPAFSAGCHTATGGNPFYVTELLRGLRRDGVAGDAASLPSVDALRPRAVLDAALARLARLPGATKRVAEAIAVLEPNAELRWVAAITDVDIDAVVHAADALHDLGMLRSVGPCRYEHPILRSAVESGVAPARRERMHLTAAGVLADAGLAVETVAAHLMQTAPSGEGFVVPTLRRAAEHASARDAPASAVAYLQRALAERPSRDERRVLLLEMGTAGVRVKHPEATGYLRQALALADDPDDAAVAAYRLGQALMQTGAIDDAYAIVDRVVTSTDGHRSRLAERLECFLIVISGPAGRIPDTADRAAAFAAREPPDASRSVVVQATLALCDLAAGKPRELVRRRVESALAGRARLLSAARDPEIGIEGPGMALLWIDELDRATQLFTEAIDGASRAGRIAAFENHSALRGFALQRRGDLADASADLEPALAAAAEGGSAGPATVLALIAQVLVEIDRGRANVGEMLARMAPIPPSLERTPIVALLRHAQAAAQLAQRKLGAAAATLTTVGEVCAATAIDAPAMFPWRSDLALAWAGTDRHGDAIELAADELRLADACGVHRARGRALLALGLLEGGAAGLERLRAAVCAFELSAGRLELGWARFQLGAALRRAGRRREARDPLDRALERALASGAELLAGHCLEELQALGARPRSVMLTGVDSLTPAERRVCRLATQGLKNKEIAQALFVSLKTVETHLRSSYRKLDIASRGELRAAISVG
jgi:DNA-binding CsgD family transcriptional regulator